MVVYSSYVHNRSIVSNMFVCFSGFVCVRIAVFSVTVFYDERVVIVAEQRPDASEEDSFQWMSRVLQVKWKNV